MQKQDKGCNYTYSYNEQGKLSAFCKAYDLIVILTQAIFHVRVCLINEICALHYVV